jgi:phosphate-selective porin OprO/OprP
MSIFRPTALALALSALCGTAQAGDFTIAPIANIQYDWNRFSNDRAQFVDNDDFRRARTGVQAKWASGVELKAEYDWEPGTWTDVFAKIPLGPGVLQAGHFKQPIGLEELTSSKTVTFMERALPTNLDLARRVGVSYTYLGTNWTLVGSVHGQDSTGANDGRGYVLRGTWAPTLADGSLIHLGASLATEDPDSNTARFRARPEARLTDIRLVDTGTLTGVNDIDRLGLEAAWLRGPWSVQAEYLRATAQRSGASDVSGDGYYVFGSWFPSGHSRVYKNGVFDAPKLADGEHAWELGLRYSTLDLDDGAVLGGEESNWTAGATLYWNKHVRFMGNYVHADSERRGNADDPHVVEFRVQFVY